MDERSEEGAVQLPSDERVEELALRAFNEGEFALLGWADNGVMQPLNHPVRFTFDVTSRPDRSHEDAVLVIAIAVPHPDIWTMDEVLNGCTHRHGREDAALGESVFDVCSTCGLVYPWEEGERG